MELALNLSWALLALSAIGLWFRFRPREGRDRGLQLVALVMLIAILFPVISVSDDLVAVQKLTLSDEWSLRKHIHSGGHPFVLDVATLLPQGALSPPQHFWRCAAIADIVPGVSFGIRTEIHNRPPPIS